MWLLIHVFAIVGFAEPWLPKGRISFSSLSYLTNKVDSKTLNSHTFVGMWKSIGCSGITHNTTEVHVVAQRSHNPCTALPDPATMGDIRGKKPGVAPTFLG